MRSSYEERALKVRNPQGKKLLSIMAKKKTNLGVALDVVNAEELLALADLLGPEVCLVKTHIDTLADFTPKVVEDLKRLSLKHEFLIFEDRKFADIGSVVVKQYVEGIYRIAEWADIINAHIISGPGIIQSLRKAGLPRGKGLLLIAEMSASGNLFTEVYSATAVRWAMQYSDFTMGFIAGRKLSYDETMISVTPGVHISESNDVIDQTYRTPETVIALSGSDVILVGRGIYAAADPLNQAREYREKGYNSYIQSINKQFVV